MHYYILFARFLMFSLASSVNISNISSDYEILLTSDDKNEEIYEQEVIFDQSKIDNQENTVEISTEIIDFTTSSNGKLNKISDEKEQIITNKLKNIFNVGHIDTNKKMTDDFMVPQFMTDLYYTVTNQNENSLQKIAYGASTIISIPEIDQSTPGSFKFDLGDLSNQEILEAELHIYRIGREVSIPLHHSPYYLLRIYQVLPNENLISWNPDLNQLLNVHYVSSFITGWQVFKIKRAIDSWLNESAPNLGFLVTASSVINEPIEINFARRNRFSNKYQPSLVLFTRTKNSQSPTHNNVKHLQTSKSFECSKLPMFINFTTKYFENFIIEPKGFEGFQCKGSCSSPENLESPNYSLLQNILNNLNSVSHNVLCCVPEKLRYLIVLYLSGDKIVLQLIEDMIIESCSCR